MALRRTLKPSSIEENHDGDPLHLSFWLMRKVVVCEATQKTIAVTVRVFVKERFTKVVGVSSLQFKLAFTRAQTGYWYFKITIFTAISKQKS